MLNYFVHASSYIDGNVTIGEGTKIWYFCHVQSNATIGKNCNIGQNVNIANNVKIGNNCKIQNNVSVYEGVEIEDDVFCGPSMVFTNDLTPRASIRREYKKTILRKGCSIGANATIVCGNEVGEYAMVAAGSVVTRNVKPHALVMGVPAKQTGWVCVCGNILNDDHRCPSCNKKYILSDGEMKGLEE
ncbi:acyltransferase [Gallibacter sp. Marseille-QA0791]|uniref:acyltransferase n=1 Tax=Gallibacter sp. Marseille-QA0791 TaxID=3378781 RepID=UPI003D0EE14B